MKIYRPINIGLKPSLGGFLQRLSLAKRKLFASTASLLLAGAAIFSTQNSLGTFSFLAGIIVGLLTIYLGSKWALMPLSEAVKVAQKEINNPLMALIYTGRDDEIGQIQLPRMMLQAKVRTILSRISDASTKISSAAQDSSNSVQDINDSLHVQAGETDLVSTAITEMAASVGEVARTAAHAAGAGQGGRCGAADGAGAAGGCGRKYRSRSGQRAVWLPAGVLPWARAG